MDTEEHSLDLMRKTAASVLAKAVKDVFPSALLLGGRVTSTGFYYEFAFPFSFQPSFLCQIEDRMYGLIRQNIHVRLKEMVPFSAKELFYSIGEKWVAQKMEASESSLVSLIDIGGWVDVFDGEESLSCLGQIGVIKLYKSEDVGSKERCRVTRIYGTAFSNRNELKSFLKKLEDGADLSHIVAGEEMGLFKSLEEGRWLWLDNGLVVKNLLLSFFEKQIVLNGFSLMQTLPCREEESIPKIGRLDDEIKDLLFASTNKKISETCIVYNSGLQEFTSGLFETECKTQNISRIFCTESEVPLQFISSLHFMTKIFKILDFDSTVVILTQSGSSRKKLKNQVVQDVLKLVRQEQMSAVYEQVHQEEDVKIEWRVKDGLGRKWPVSILAYCQANHTALFWSVFLSLERWIALLLEKNRGELPFWLVPKQVYVLPVQSEYESYAEEVAKLLIEDGFRVEVKTAAPLKSRVHEALKQKVPVLLVVGEKEAESRSVMLRKTKENEASSVLLQDVRREITKYINRE